MAKRNPAAAAVPAAALARPGKPLGQRIMDNWQLYLLLLVPVVLTFVYKYIPMYGIQIAFRDFKASRGYMGSEWVGWYWFERFFSAPHLRPDDSEHRAHQPVQPALELSGAHHPVPDD